MNNPRFYYDPESCVIRSRHPFDDIAEIAKMNQVDFVENISVTIVCKFCGSPNVIKFGVKNNVQYYWCKRCKRKFASNNALPGMRFPPDQIASALNMFYEGLSLNAIRRHLQHDYAVRPSDSTVYEWVVRFTKQAVSHSSGLKAETSETWVVDETMLRLDKKHAWFWDIIDDETRYLVGSNLTLSQTSKAAITVMERGKQTAHKPPKYIVSDGLRAYPGAVRNVFGDDTLHVRSGGFAAEVNTNLVERLHGTIKQRTKVMRGMQNLQTAEIIMSGWAIHYNHFRPHEGLENSIPGKVAKVGYPFNSWMEVVTYNWIPTEHRVKTTIPT